MYLSELYGRIDGIVGTNISNFVDFSSEDFGVLNNYKVEQIDENTFKGRKVGQYFIIKIPFN